MHAITVNGTGTMMLFDVYDVQSVASFRIRQSYVSCIRLPVQEYEYYVPVTATHRTTTEKWSRNYCARELQKKSPKSFIHMHYALIVWR